MPCLAGTPIAMDEFQFRSGVYIYLLSHMHADHTSGLTSTWDFGTVYCSPISRRLLLDKFGVEPDRVVALEVGVAHLLPMDQVGREDRKAPQGADRVTKAVTMMTVTLVDANHCPGSVMFVLEGYFGRVLYTGDFRFCPRLHTGAIFGKDFGTVFVDNTYCNPAADFPARPPVANLLAEMVKCKRGYRVLVGVDNLGKEEFLLRLAEVLQEPVCVSPARMHWLELCEIDLARFTTDPRRSRIHVLPKRQITYERVQAVRDAGVPCVGLRPTGWAPGQQGVEAVNSSGGAWQAALKELDWDTERVVWVPYSLHSSFRELQLFCGGLRFARLLPIVPQDYGMHVGHLHPSKPVSPDCAAALCSPPPVALRQAMALCSTRPSRKRKPLGTGTVRKSRVWGAQFVECNGTPADPAASERQAEAASVQEGGAPKPHGGVGDVAGNGGGVADTAPATAPSARVQSPPPPKEPCSSQAHTLQQRQNNTPDYERFRKFIKDAG